MDSGVRPEVWPRCFVRKASACITWVQSLGREDTLEKEMATHSSILAWKIPWTEKSGRLQSMKSQDLDNLVTKPTLLLSSFESYVI